MKKVDYSLIFILIKFCGSIYIRKILWEQNQNVQVWRKMASGNSKTNQIIYEGLMSEKPL